jgi:RNA polymerase sigma-70 factor (ECF subfamily)
LSPTSFSSSSLDGRRLSEEPVQMWKSKKPPAALTFENVYRTYFRLVWRTLGRLGVREADLLDVTQNVFIVVHRQLSGFEGRAQLTTWLFSICRLVARDYLRSAPIRREIVVDFDEFALKDVQPETQLDHLDKKDLSRVLDAALEKLPERLRAVFVLFELEEMSGDDIATLLEIPVGTVRSRLRMAREHWDGVVQGARP